MKIYNVIQDGNLLAVISAKDEADKIKYEDYLKEKLKELKLSEDFKSEKLDNFKKDILEEWLWAVSEKEWKMRRLYLLPK